MSHNVATESQGTETPAVKQSSASFDADEVGQEQIRQMAQKAHSTVQYGTAPYSTVLHLCAVQYDVFVSILVNMTAVCLKFTSHQLL